MKQILIQRYVFPDWTMMTADGYVDILAGRKRKAT